MDYLETFVTLAKILAGCIKYQQGEEVSFDDEFEKLLSTDNIYLKHYAQELKDRIEKNGNIDRVINKLADILLDLHRKISNQTYIKIEDNSLNTEKIKELANKIKADLDRINNEEVDRIVEKIMEADKFGKNSRKYSIRSLLLCCIVMKLEDIDANIMANIIVRDREIAERVGIGEQRKHSLIAQAIKTFEEVWLKNGFGVMVGRLIENLRESKEMEENILKVMNEISQKENEIKKLALKIKKKEDVKYSTENILKAIVIVKKLRLSEFAFCDMVFNNRRLRKALGFENAPSPNSIYNTIRYRIPEKYRKELYEMFGIKHEKKRDYPPCPHCNSGSVKRAGVKTTRKGKLQRYRCKSCGRTFFELIEEASETEHKHDERIVEEAVELYMKGMKIKDVAHKLSRAYTTTVTEENVRGWIDEHLKKELQKLGSTQKRRLVMRRVVELMDDGINDVKEITRYMDERLGYRIYASTVFNIYTAYRKLRKLEEVIRANMREGKSLKEIALLIEKKNGTEIPLELMEIMFGGEE